MLPTPKEFCELFDHMLTNTPQGSPRNVNIYKTRGYFADMPLIPLAVPQRPTGVFSKVLKVTVTLSKKGHASKWQLPDPKPNDISKALRSIQRGEYHSYMILSMPGRSCIQTNIHTLEYREGSADKHYYCPPEFLSTEVILKAFLSYRCEGIWWKDSIPWTKGCGP